MKAAFNMYRPESVCCRDVKEVLGNVTHWWNLAVTV